MSKSIRIKVAADTVFSADVPVTVFGEEKPIEFGFDFVYQDAQAVEAWRKDYNERRESRTDADFLAPVIKGWRAPLIDDDGQPVPYSKEALADFFRYHQAAALDIYSGYLRSVKQSRVGN